MAILEWRGQWGLLHGLLPLRYQGSSEPPPHILLVHSGGNDLGQVKGKALIWQTRNDVQVIHECWTDNLIVWSAILPCKVWQGVSDPMNIDRAHRKTNKEIGRAIEAGLGLCLGYPNIQFHCPDLYQQDRVHLSLHGNELFLQGIW